MTQGLDRRGRWVFVGLLTLGGGAIASAVRLEHEGLNAEHHVLIGGLVVAATLLLALIDALDGRREGWAGNIGRGVAVGFGIALVVYLFPPGVGGRGDFQIRSLVAFAVATAALPILHPGEPGFYPRWFGAAVGVVLPPALLVGLITAACGSEGCWR